MIIKYGDMEFDVSAIISIASAFMALLSFGFALYVYLRTDRKIKEQQIQINKLDIDKRKEDLENKKKAKIRVHMIKEKWVIEDGRVGYERYLVIENKGKLLQDRIFNNSGDSDKVSKENQISFNGKYNPSDVLENYHFWNDQPIRQGRRNIFEGIDEAGFLKMIDEADFSTIFKDGLKDRIRYNIHILSKIIGREWGEIAASKLNTTLRACSSRSDFEEYEKLKNLFEERCLLKKKSV